MTILNQHCKLFRYFQEPELRAQQTEQVFPLDILRWDGALFTCPAFYFINQHSSGLKPDEWACFPPASVSHRRPQQLTRCPLAMRAVAYWVWCIVGEKSAVKPSRHKCQPMDSLIMLDSTWESSLHWAESEAPVAARRLAALGRDRIWKCFMSERGLTGAHGGRLMSPVFRVWHEKWNFDRRDEKPFTCRGESAFAGLTAAGEGCRVTTCEEGDTEK